MTNPCGDDMKELECTPGVEAIGETEEAAGIGQEVIIIILPGKAIKPSGKDQFARRMLLRHISECGFDQGNLATTYRPKAHSSRREDQAVEQVVERIRIGNQVQLRPTIRMLPSVEAELPELAHYCQSFHWMGRMG